MIATSGGVYILQSQLIRWVRYAIGYVFIATGIVSLLVPSFQMMFINLGIPFPEMTFLLVAFIEILCGSLIVAGMYLHYATVPLIVIMIGALVLTKLPIFINEGIFLFALEARLDIVMLILLVSLWRHYK